MSFKPKKPDSEKPDPIRNESDVSEFFDLSDTFMGHLESFDFDNTHPNPKLSVSPSKNNKKCSIFTIKSNRNNLNTNRCTANCTVAPQNPDEVGTNKGDPLKVHYFDKSQHFGKVTNLNTGKVGWISVNALSKKRSQIKLPRYVHNYEVPQAFENNLKYVKRLQKLESLLPLLDNGESEKHHEIVEDFPGIEMALEEDLTIDGNTTIFAKIKPLNEVNDFIVMDHTQKCLDILQIDTIRGSYAPEHGGICGFHNYGKRSKTLKAGQVIGIARKVSEATRPVLSTKLVEIASLEIDRARHLAGMLAAKALARQAAYRALKQADPPQKGRSKRAYRSFEILSLSVGNNKTQEIKISSDSMDKIEKILTKKEESKIEFEKLLEEYDGDLQVVLRKYTKMFLANNDYCWELLNIPEVTLPTRPDMPETLPAAYYRRLTKEHIEAIDLYIEAGLLSGFLKRVRSPFAANLMVVKKPGGGYRAVVDARGQNKKLLAPVAYSLPKMSTLVEKLSKNTIFSTCDASGAFGLIPISEESQRLVAFAVHTTRYAGTYTTVGMPQGILSGPAIYQNMIDEQVVQRCQDGIDEHSAVNSYIDDLAISSRSTPARGSIPARTDRENHLIALDRVLSRLYEINMRMNLKKCKFMQDSLVFCGYELSGGTYRPAEKHIEFLKNLPRFSVLDNSKNAILRHLGVLNYHRRFAGKSYAEIDCEIRSTYKLYQENKISASKADEIIAKLTDKAIDEIIKNRLISPDPDDEIEIQSDSSTTSWGAVLLVKNKGVVSYHGGTFPSSLTKAVNKPSIFHLECLAMYNALNLNLEFLINAANVTVSVDNLATSISSMSDKADITPRDINVILKIQQILNSLKCVPKVRHLPGVENSASDYISRMVFSALDKPVKHLAALSSGMDSVDPIEGNAVSDFFRNIEFTEDDYLYNPRLCREPFENVMESQISVEKVLGEREIDAETIEIYKKLKIEHSQCHWAQAKHLETIEKSKRQKYKPLIKRVISECSKCCNVPTKIAPYSKLTKIPTPYYPFEHIFCDFIIMQENDHSSEGHTVLMTFQCALSRYCIGIALKTKGMETVCHTLTSIMTTLSVKPEILHFDNEFDSNSLRKFADFHNVKLHFRCSGSSRSNQVERTHRTFHSYRARIMDGENSRQWNCFLPQIFEAINKAPNQTTGVAPFKVIFGSDPDKLYNEKFEKSEDEISKYRKNLIKMIRKRSEKSKNQYSGDHKWPVLEEGEVVLVRFSGSRLEKFNSAVVSEHSDNKSPSVVIKYDTGREIKVHKGHVYKKKVPVNPLIEAEVNSRAESEVVLEDNELEKNIRPIRNRRKPDRLQM